MMALGEGGEGTGLRSINQSPSRSPSHGGTLSSFAQSFPFEKSVTISESMSQVDYGSVYNSVAGDSLSTLSCFEKDEATRISEAVSRAAMRSRQAIQSQRVQGSRSTLSTSTWATPKNVARTLGEVGKGLEAAFTETSLAHSKAQGYYGAEEYTILRQVAIHPDRMEAFERAEPVYLLRNPKPANASLELPTEENVTNSEVCVRVCLSAELIL